MPRLHSITTKYDDAPFPDSGTIMALRVCLSDNILDTNGKRRELSNLLEEAVSEALAKYELGVR